MASRRGKKRQSTPAYIKAGISKRQYETLKRNAEQARASIKAQIKSPTVDTSALPDPRQYYMAEILKRVKAGESTKAINYELRGIKSGKPVAVPFKFESDFGQRVSKAEYEAIQAAVKKANKNIQKARANYEPELQPVLPKDFNANQILKEITKPEDIQNWLADLKLFTPGKLKIKAISEEGVAGTEAEKQYINRIITRENLRRAHIRELREDTLQQKGYMRMGEEQGRAPIKISESDDIENRRKRASKYTSPATLYKANTWLDRYINSFGLIQMQMLRSGVYDDEIDELMEQIIKLSERFYNNEQAITALANTAQYIQIENNYPDSGFSIIDLNLIYAELQEYADRWL